jgi:hypothetical protein
VFAAANAPVLLPMTLGQALAAKVRLMVWRKRWQHQAERDVTNQVALYGGDTTVLDWTRRLRCSACAGRELDFVISSAAR